METIKRYFSFLLVISLLLTGAFPVYAVTDDTAPVSWENLSPLPSGSNVSALARGGTNNATLVIVGEGGTVASLSGATTWAIRNSGVNTDLNDVLYAGSQFVAVGDGGTVITSADGISWMPRTTANQTLNLNAIAYGGGKYVAIGDSGRVTTSTNGTSWSESILVPTGVNLNAIVYGNGRFVAVGDGGTIIDSTDGLVWSVQNSGSIQDLNGISYGAGVFVAAGAEGELLSAPNTLGLWSRQTNGMTNFNSVTFSSSGNRFLVAGDSGRLISSTNGTSWSASIPVAGTSNNLLKVIFTGQGYFIVGANGTVFVTNLNSGGVSGWAEYSSVTPSALKAITYADGTYVAGGTAGLIGRSTDGSIWSKVVSGTVEDINSIAYGNNLFAAVGSNGQIMTSGNGTSWSSKTQSPANTATLNGIVYGGGVPMFSSRFVAVGNLGRIVTSTDGDNWTQATNNMTGNNLNAVAYGRGSYVAVGEGGVIVTSPDGNFWITSPSGTLNSLKSITYGRGMFVAVGESGTVLSSTDGFTWKPEVSGVNTNLNGVAFGSGTFVAAGNGGNVIFSSDSAKTWSLQDSMVTGTSRMLNGIGYITGEDQFIAVGDPGVMIVSNRFINKPLVNTMSPAPAATGVETDTNLVLTFNQNVTAAANRNITIYKATDTTTPVETIPANDGRVTIVNNVVTINPQNNLDQNTNYIVRVQSRAFLDAENGESLSISGSTWSFTTKANPDTTPPTVSGLSPMSETTGVAIDSDLTLTFTETVMKGTGNIVIYKRTDNGNEDVETIPVTSGNVSIDATIGNVVTINPSDDLENGTDYFVTIDAGAFKDAAGNNHAGISGTTWQFTTASEPDRISPTVSTYSPEPGAMDVAIGANLILTFSEDVRPSEGNIEIYNSSNDATPVITIPAASLDYVTILNNEVTINPADNLEYGTSYFVRITEGAFKDAAGNSFAGITDNTTWRFMTTSMPDTAAPLVTAFSPADNATNVGVSSVLTLTFNENVKAGDGNIIIMNTANDTVVTTIRANNTALVNITNATVTIHTNGQLTQGGSYYVVIQPGAFTDEAGNGFAGIADKTVWNFSTVLVPVTPDPGPGTPAPVVPAPTAAPSTTTETIPANVENGAAQGSTVSSVAITRTRDASGVKRDTLTFTSDQVLRAINELKAAGSNIARINIPDAADEVAETRLTIPAASSKQLADNQISLDLFTVNAQVKVPGSSLAGFSSDIYFNLIPLKSQQQSAEAEARARAEIQSLASGEVVTLVSRPVTIDTNLQSRPVTLVLPVNNASLTPAELQALAVFIEHSDGTKELLKGEIVPFGQTGKSGIQFNVNKFSTFTVVLAQDPAVAVKAYMTGYTDGTFKPGRSITRAEAASIIARTFSQTGTTSGAAYTDVAAGHWAASAIRQVSTSGIMKGYEDGSFKPNQTITRAEMATILSRLISNAQGNAVSFSDITGHWAQAAVEMTARAGLITGYEDGTFRPNQSLTRAEAVTIINRALGIAPLTSAAPKWTDVPAQYWAFGSIQAASVDHTAE